jgi:hypothetical protein
MKPLKFYVAGGMRGYPDNNFPAFDAACASIRERGHIAIGPQEFDRLCGFTEAHMREHDVTDADIRNFMARDLLLIIHEADAICVLPGWQHSKGAVTEVALGLMLRLKIVDTTLQPINVILGVESWTQP